MAIESTVEAHPIQGQGNSSVAERSFSELIGNTPLIRLRSLEPKPGVEVYGKAEWVNPGGSVKDRAALAMIEAGERSGELTGDKILIDSTSGNTGIAYAMICKERGYRVMLCMSARASEERKQILRDYGAELILTDPAESSDGAIREVRRRVEENPDIYFYPDQYSNDENWKAHYRTTAPEIWEQTGGRITHFVAGLGTSGTFVGVGRRLKEYNPEVQIVAMQPDSPLHGLEGLKHMATAIVPRIYDPELADRNVEIETEQAYEMIRHIDTEEGILVGISAAGALVVARDLAAEIDHGVIVTILPDSGNRYLAESPWKLAND
jgi:S-sulfo-L-cysteine synthase (O-acetyl-L-serine-dependent)